MSVRAVSKLEKTIQCCAIEGICWRDSSLELNLSVDISCRIRVDQFVVDA